MAKDLIDAYLLYYVKEHDDGHEDTELLGIFSTEENANRTLSKVIKTPEFKNTPNLFEISTCRVNRLGWIEGYITLDY